MAEVAVVHLVRKQNGPAPLCRFIESWRAYPPGLDHELVIVFKGFEEDFTRYDELLDGVSHRRIFMADRGLDLASYFEAALLLDYKYFCFLNSFSRVLAHGWLELLFRCIRSEGVGLVGATGSHQSIAGGYTKQELDLRALTPGTQFAWRVRRALRDRRPNAMSQRAIRLVLRLAGVWRPARDFAPFPNPHVRTNAFMASRDILMRMRPGSIRMKHSAYKFESGVEGLTSRIRRLGQKALVVGRDGRGYEPETWPLSNTFWQSREENLLVADNQTELYMEADAATRAELAQYAWGDQARPG